jgi:protein-disulfide isomerase
MGVGIMSEEKNHEHKEHHHGYHSHGKKDEKYRFELSKIRVWQGISFLLAIAVVFLWFNQGSDVPETAQVPQPLIQPPSPTPQQPIQPTKLKIDIDDDPMKGSKNAPVTIVEFSDFQCPFCGRFFTQTLPSIEKEYIDTGKVKFVYRDFPLGFHPNAQPAAEAAECANEQGKFWEYHDEIFKNQEQLSSDLYIQLAEELSLDVEKFKKCVEAGKYKQEVQDDFDYGKSVGVTGTPAFFINGIKIVGAQPFENFKKIIDAELADQ